MQPFLLKTHQKNKQKIMYKKTIAITTTILALISCNKTNNHVPTCNGGSPTYETTVKPIIKTNCVTCHNGENGYNKNDVLLNSYAALKSSIEKGKFEKVVLKKQTMPTLGPLSADNLDILRCWLDNGYPEN